MNKNMSHYPTLKDILFSSKLEFLMEAHSGISAKIVEETGFKGIWASGLSIATSYGVRDCNEASWTQVLETIEFMSDCTRIPILMDADTGFGDFNNLRRLIKSLIKIRVSGVCIEDKIFPKRNSFFKNSIQELEDVATFCGKIKAAKDTQLDENFVVIARTEGFITGLNTEQVIERAAAYSDAGADGILVHSKLNNTIQIAEFIKYWDKRKPIIIVPTIYKDTSYQLFKSLGISIVIWANHNLRASIKAMKKICAKIYKQNSLHGIDSDLVELEEIFRLTDVEELIRAERKYKR